MMIRILKLSGFVLLLILLIGITQFSYSKTMISHAFDIELEPISPLVTDAPITMKLAFTPHIKYPWCKDVKITVKTLNYDNTLSEESWDAELDENQRYSTTFQVSIPDNDTSAVYATLESRWLRETFKLFFVTTGDSIVRKGGDPRGHVPMPPRMLVLIQIGTR
jgi:hypothetical protein